MIVVVVVADTLYVEECLAHESSRYVAEKKISKSAMDKTNRYVEGAELHGDGQRQRKQFGWWKTGKEAFVTEGPQHLSACWAYARSPSPREPSSTDMYVIMRRR